MGSLTNPRLLVSMDAGSRVSYHSSCNLFKELVNLIVPSYEARTIWLKEWKDGSFNIFLQCEFRESECMGLPRWKLIADLASFHGRTDNCLYFSTVVPWLGSL